MANLGIFTPAGIIASDEKQLLFISIGLMLIVVIPVIILTVVFAWKYRASNTKAKYSPEFTHSNLLEIIWWGIPIILIGILSVITWISSHKYDPYRPLDVNTPPLEIQVVALDWKWLFIYPKQHIASVNLVEIPVNTPIKFVITSDAPMNSFEVPELAGQIYAMPGMRTELNLMATRTGEFPGYSANYTGIGFAGMNFKAKVVSAEEYENWVKTSKKSENKLTQTNYDQLARQSENNPVAIYSDPADDLFYNIIMKYMMPMPQKQVTP